MRPLTEPKVPQRKWCQGSPTQNRGRFLSNPGEHDVVLILMAGWLGTRNVGGKRSSRLSRLVVVKNGKNLAHLFIYLKMVGLGMGFLVAINFCWISEVPACQSTATPCS